MDNKNKTIEERIKDKRAEIERLKKEIKELRGPSGLAEMVKQGMFYTNSVNIKFKERKCPDEALWQHICRVCYEIHRRKHRAENMSFKTLNKDEKKTSALMADEIIGIWNKYVFKLYHEEIDADTLNEYAYMLEITEEDSEKPKQKTWSRKARRVLLTNTKTDEKYLYKSVTDAAKHCGDASRYQIASWCENKKQIGGYKWEYYDGDVMGI